MWTRGDKGERLIGGCSRGFDWAETCATTTGVEQDDPELLRAGVASLRGYITLCDAVIIPAPSVPEGAVRTVDMVPGGYVHAAHGVLG